MKKRILLCLVLSLFLSFCSCAPISTVPQTVQTETTSIGAESTETTAAALPADTPYHFTRAQTLDFLDGGWEMLAGGDMIRLEPYAVLRFDSAHRTMIFTRQEDGAYVKAQFSLSDLFEVPDNTNDLLEVYPDDVSENFVRDAEKVVLGTRTDFEIRMACTDDGLPLLALREIGNGGTALAMEGFGEDVCAGEGFWVFERMEETGSAVTSPSDDRIRNDTFYAFRWQDLGSECDLQPLLLDKSFRDDWYGEPVTVFQFAYSARFQTRCTRYTIRGADDLAHSGAYSTGVVRVTTDGNGDILSIQPVECLGFGAYKQS